MDEGKKSLHLSKSRMMQGLQCEKQLHLAVHQPELIPPVSESQQRRFDNGHLVGELAQKRFPGGVLIDADYKDLAVCVQQTKAAMANGAGTIYEATFEKDGLTARIDVLNRLGNKWQLIEVKSATRLKDEYVQDAAFQKMVLESAGVTLEKVFVMYLNPACEFPNLENLFVQMDVTDLVSKEIPVVAARVKAFQQMLATAATPEKKIGQHCTYPSDCPFYEHCWSVLPSPSIFDVPGIYKEKWEFYAKGITEISDSRFGPFAGVTVEHIKAHVTGQRWVNAEGIKAAIKDWKWPLIHLDFETIDFPVPQFKATRPYQHVPFQFSALLEERPGVVAKSYMYLHEENSDPRAKLVEPLIQALRGEGSVVSYYKAFEEACLKGLAKEFPHHAEVLLSACERLVDPLPVFRTCVYDKKFGSSFSIKSVAPAILGEQASYKKMEVADGTKAQTAFMKLISNEITSEEKAKLKKAMIEYCNKDTRVMMELVDWLYQVAGGLHD